MLSPKAKRKMLMPPDLIEYVKGHKKESFVQVLERINTITKRLGEVPHKKEKYSHPVPELLVPRYQSQARAKLSQFYDQEIMTAGEQQEHNNKNSADTRKNHSSSFHLSRQKPHKALEAPVLRQSIPHLKGLKKNHRVSQSVTAKNTGILFGEDTE